MKKREMSKRSGKQKSEEGVKAKLVKGEKWRKGLMDSQLLIVLCASIRRDGVAEGCEEKQVIQAS